MAQRFTYLQIQDTTTDLSMVAWPYADHDDKSTRAVVYFDKPVQIDGDLWVGMLDEELTKWVLDGTEPPGRNYVPTRQYTGGYAFIRTNPPLQRQMRAISTRTPGCATL